MLVPFLSNRCGLFHTISLREKWSSQLTWELCCSLRDQRCYQHHNHKQDPHLAAHYSYGRRICTGKARRLLTMLTRSFLPRTDCNSCRTRVHYSSPSTNSPNHNCSSGTITFAVSLCFIARNQFPVGILATNLWHRQKFFIPSSVCAGGSGGVGAV